MGKVMGSISALTPRKAGLATMTSRSRSRLLKPNATSLVSTSFCSLALANVRLGAQIRHGHAQSRQEEMQA